MLAYFIHSESLMQSLIWLICVGLVFYLLFWLIGYVALPEPFAKIAKVLLALVAVLILIDLIMGFADGYGRPGIHRGSDIDVRIGR